MKEHSDQAVAAQDDITAMTVLQSEDGNDIVT